MQTVEDQILVCLNNNCIEFRFPIAIPILKNNLGPSSIISFFTLVPQEID